MPHPQDKIAALLDNLKILETQKEHLHAFYLFSVVTGEIFIAFFFFFSKTGEGSCFTCFLYFILQFRPYFIPLVCLFPSNKYFIA